MSDSAVHGPCAVVYPVDRLNTAKDWHSRMLDIDPRLRSFYGRLQYRWLRTRPFAWCERREGIGERICVAAVEDPFGDMVGIIETPPFELPDAA